MEAFLSLPKDRHGRKMLVEPSRELLLMHFPEGAQPFITKEEQDEETGLRGSGTARRGRDKPAFNPLAWMVPRAPLGYGPHMENRHLITINDYN